MYRSSVPENYNSYPWRIDRQNLFIRDIDTSESVELTYGKDVNLAPSWSPDGSRVVFLSDESGKYEIYVINSNGGGRLKLTENLGGVPDTLGSSNLAIFYAGPYGGLSEKEARLVKPKFTLDGSGIIFLSGLKSKKGLWQFYTMNLDGSNLEKINNVPVNDFFDIRQPAIPFEFEGTSHPLGIYAKGSEYITFTSGPADKEDIFAINQDGSGMTRLTFQGYRKSGGYGTGVFRSYGAMPSPDGTTIIYKSINSSKSGKSSPAYSPFYFEGSGLKRIDSDGFGDCWVYADAETIATKNASRPDYKTGYSISTLDVKSLIFSWSPDGRKIAMADGGIKILRADDNESMQSFVTLTNDPNHESPVWSPNGAKIAFRSGSYVGNYSEWISALGKEGLSATLNIIDENGTLSEIFNIEDGAIGEISWSPDGDKISFATLHNQSRKSAVYIINSDGSSREILTDLSRPYQEIIWSPDGSKISFVVATDKQETDIFTINLDGSGERQLTEAPGANEDISWSPDGEKIVFTSTRHGKDKEIYVMNSDGGEVTRITDNDVDDTNPKWSNWFVGDNAAQYLGIFDFKCPHFSP